MNSSPKVSVIIINYNYGAFIKEALESALHQTYQDFEIIVIDDGSTDNSRFVIESVIREHTDKIKYHYQNNQGLSAARNKGIALSSGELIAFLDADDIWLPEKLHIQAPIFDKFPEVGVCCTDFINFIQNNEMGSFFVSLKEIRNLKYEIPLNNDYVLEMILKENFVGAMTVVLRKSIVDQIGQFNEKLKVCEDYDYWLRCALVAKFLVINTPLVRRRIHGSNVTGNYLIIAQYLEKTLTNFYANNHAYLKENGFITNIKEALANNQYMLGDLQFEKGYYFQPMKSYWKAFFYNLTFYNFIVFLGFVLRKLLRIISFGLISRKNLLSKWKFN